MCVSESAANTHLSHGDFLGPCMDCPQYFQAPISNAEPDVDKMPVYTSDQVAERNGEDGKQVWMSYGGIVYNVTDFVQNHPGGSNMIMMAAGSVRARVGWKRVDPAGQRFPDKSS